jgi:Holliday junction resolvasome RuvABC ATP-dependent DNA helicase subunit
MPRPPARLNGFIGQRRIIKWLMSLIFGSKMLGRTLGSMLFIGREGIGKTALAKAVAAEFGTSVIYRLAGPETDRDNMVSELLGLKYGDILFIDEGHNLPRPTQELLLPALVDRKIPSPTRKDGATDDAWLSIPDFTLIIATNTPSRLAKALCNRLRDVNFDAYSVSELRAMAQKHGAEQGIDIKGMAAGLIADVVAGSRENPIGTPRDVGKLVDELMELLPENTSIGKEDVDSVFRSHLMIDEHGLREHHRRYLSALREGSCSLQRLATVLGQDPRYLAEYMEPLLFVKGLFEVSKCGGRSLTDKGKQVVAGFAPPETDNQQTE